MSETISDTNNFIFTYNYQPLTEVENQEKQNNRVSGEKNMDDILEKYKTFLGVKYRKQNSINTYYYTAKKFLTYVSDITKNEIDRYITYLNQTQKQKSIRDNIIGMNKLLEHINKPELCVTVPRDNRITRNTITREQIIQLIDYTRKHRGYQDYIILLMIRDLKCRNHEIIKTRWDWIRDGRIHFIDCKTGDTSGPISQELQDALEHWRTITPYPDNPYVFCILRRQYKGRQMSCHGNYIRDMINTISQTVVGRRIGPQDLRASVITAEFSNHVNPRVIMMTARHRNLETTLIYNHADENDALEYITSGTIFNNTRLLPSTSKDRKHKPYGIYNFTPDLVNGEDDNNNVSFSFSFFNQTTSGVWEHDFIPPTSPSSYIAHAPVLLTMGGQMEDEHTLLDHHIGVLTHFTNELPSRNPYNDCDWINDACLGWSKLEQSSASVQSQRFCNNNINKYFI